MFPVHKLLRTWALASPLFKEMVFDAGAGILRSSCISAVALESRVFTNRLYSGRKIVEILKKNPKKDPSKYDEDDIAHMRRVAAYNKRHLAQEEKAKQDSNSKSYKSLKNWGHDAQKET